MSEKITGCSCCYRKEKLYCFFIDEVRAAVRIAVSAAVRMQTRMQIRTQQRHSKIPEDTANDAKGKQMIDGFKEYTHILFDADNTLLDFTKAEKTALEQTFQKLGITLDTYTYNLYVEINHRAWQEYEAGKIESGDIPHKRFYELIQAADLRLDVDSVSQMYQSFLGEQTWLEPYAQEICEYWSKKASISIITNGFKETQEKRIKASKIWPYVSHLIISEVIGVTKPDPAFFSRTFEIINCSNPGAALVVGDSLSSDILGAMNAGIDCCWYNTKGIVLPESYCVTYQIDKLEQLKV